MNVKLFLATLVVTAGLQGFAADEKLTSLCMEDTMQGYHTYYPIREILLIETDGKVALLVNEKVMRNNKEVVVEKLRAPFTLSHGENTHTYTSEGGDKIVFIDRNIKGQWWRSARINDDKEFPCINDYNDPNLVAIPDAQEPVHTPRSESVSSHSSSSKSLQIHMGGSKYYPVEIREYPTVTMEHVGPKWGGGVIYRDGNGNQVDYRPTTGQSVGPRYAPQPVHGDFPVRAEIGGSKYYPVQIYRNRRGDIVDQWGNP